MSGEEVFQWACRQPDLEEAIHGLCADNLRELHAYLHFLSDSGIPALVRGLVRDAAADKFLTDTPTP